MLDKLQDMLKLQEELEVRIGGPDWKQAGHDYALCVHMECAEVIELYGWKHWKDLNKIPDYDKIAMELVDIWHFALAHHLMNGGTAEELNEVIAKSTHYFTTADHSALPGMIRVMLGLGYNMVINNAFSVYDFMLAMDQANMTWDELYFYYVAKNVLNRFRQDHGYKNGAYHKNWGGREDNDHLYEVANSLGNDLNSETLYEALSFRYRLIGK